MFRSLLSLTIAWTAGVSVAAPPLVSDATFEEIASGCLTTGWHLPSAHYSAAKGEGQNGSGGLVWENDDPEFYQWPFQSVRLEAGKVYRIGARIKIDELKGDRKGVFVLLEWYDKTGKWMGGRYTPHLKAERTDDWLTHETVTQPIPEGVAEFRFGVAVAKSSTGRVRFDNAYVLPYERPIVSGVYSSVYRNAAVEGKVHFYAALNEPAEGWPSGIVASFSYRASDGTVRSVPALKLKTDAASVVLDVTDMRAGTNSVVCRVLAGTGKELGRAEMAFVRLSSRPVRAVEVDALGRTLVGGKPFFPLGMYFDKVTASELDIYTNGPFNCVMPYSPPRNRELDMCQARGLMCCYSIKGALPGTVWAHNRKLVTQADVNEHVRKLMKPVQGHSALLAWYVNDEAPLTQLGGLTELYRTISLQDPGHPAFAVMDRYYDLRDFLPSFDIIGFDPYPVPTHPISQVSEFASGFRKATFARPMWAVPQAFDWSWFRPQYKGKGRMPTADELKSMTFQAIAGGANGIIYYGYYVYRKPTCSMPFDECFGRVVSAAREVKRHERVFLSAVAGPRVRSETAAVQVRSWGDEDGSAWVLVVNTMREPVTARIDIAGMWQGASGGVLEKCLGPIGYEIVNLRRSDHE
jgi:hypothetical protein